jgi:hypothetical protein
LLGKVIARMDGMPEALCIATEKGHKEIIMFLLQRGTDVNANTGGKYANALEGAS